ncbi:MAG: FtsQ-type POTRA domain-containing protein [Gammaproteobacteria bacterium]|nr:FtsQ-type POTRA domain-containing protein [Gammaproteobacteria bacterium]
MFKLSTLVNSKKQNKQASLQFDKARKKTKNKPQASKKQPVEIIELVWLKQLFNKQFLTLFFMLSVIISAVYLLPKEDILPINKIEISGSNKQLKMGGINKNLEAYLGQGFFSVDIKLIQKKLSLEPWVESVSVKRIWPNQLQVSLIEKQAFARWDSKHLLSSQAVIFKAASKNFQHLPRINGYSDQSAELLLRYSEMQSEFSKHGIRITEMTEDSKGALNLVLNKRLKVNIGSENNDLKIKNLLSVYAKQIKPRAEFIKTIDFRYSNGFSIAWTDEYLNLKHSGDSKKRGNNNV